MTKTKYERDRDKNVKEIQDVFKSLGIRILTEDIRGSMPKQPEGKGKKLLSDNHDSDNDYDPSSDIDNQSHTDDSDEVRCITRQLTSLWSVHFNHILQCSSLIYLTLIS